MRAILLDMLGKIPKPSPAMGVALVALLIATSGVAVAGIPSDDGSVDGCYVKRTGSLRIIDTGTGQSCSSKEAAVRLAAVDATGKVANADKLDGMDSTDFSAGGTNQKATDSELLDGKDSSEFLGVNQKAADSDKLDAKDSTDFYAAGTQVADSAKLDGKTPSEFLGSNQKAADSELLDAKDSSEFLGVNQRAADSDKLDGKDSSDFASADKFGSAVEGQIGSGGVGELDCTMGEVKLFAGRAPSSWALARGQELSIAEHTALFNLLGTNYGGNGQTTFALPNLQGAEPKGAGPAAPYYAICIEGVFPG